MAWKTAVAVSLTLSFHEMQLLDCDVAFVEMMKRLFNFFRIKWIMAKKINRRGRGGSQRVVVSLSVPLRSLQFFESSQKIIKSVMMKDWKGRFLEVMEQVMQERATRSPFDTG